MVAALIAIIGAVFVTADTGEDADETEKWHMPFGIGNIFGRGAIGAKLTDEQQVVIDELINDLSEEDATVKILNIDHQLFNFQNRIREEDFDDWIQERGLYFPDEWDEKYDRLLEMNDTGESPKQGSLLFTKYGDGVFIYTGLSFFRQLPAGVPGAYKLFLNMISAGKYEK